MITASALALLSVEIRDEFRQAFRAQPPANVLYPTISRDVPTTSKTVKYTGFGARPGFKLLRDRMAAEGMAQYPYELKDDTYYNLITIEREAVEDDATGQYIAEARAIGEGVVPFYEQKILSLLTSGRTGVCYDGQPFFNDQHTGGVLNTPGAKVAQSNVATDVLSAANLAKALGTVGNYVDDKGNPYGVLPDTLLVGANNLVLASDLLRNDVVGKTTLNSVLQPKASALIPGNQWFLLSTQGPVKPTVRQRRTDIGEDGLELNDNIGSRDAWSKGEWEIGARLRAAFGYGPWWTAYGSFPN